jgi:hypothetical protein
MVKPQPGDKVDHGVKGMHWGIRRSSSQLKSDKAAHPTDSSKMLVKDSKSGEVHEAPRTKSAPEAPKKESSSPVGEDSRTRYARLQAQAKAGKANEMSEPDLKFFNARTDALAKVNKLNQTDPGWLSKTTKTVLQNAAQTAMQDVVNGVTKQYVTTPVLDALTKK